jgi:hypothetical protein
MSKRKKLGLVAVPLLLVSGGVGLVWWSLSAVPSFYRQELTETPPTTVRQAEARRLVQRTLALADDVQHADLWSEEFTQTQVNSWLAEELHRRYEKVVPRGVKEPRVRFVEDVIYVGFRYEGDDWKGIVSFRLKPWVPEPNQLAFQIDSVRAGLMPVPLEKVLEEVSQKVATDGWRAEWTQADGNDVLLIHLEPRNADAPILESVKVVTGKVRVAGRRGPESRPSATAATPLRVAGQPKSKTM